MPSRSSRRLPDPPLRHSGRRRGSGRWPRFPARRIDRERRAVRPAADAYRAMSTTTVAFTCVEPCDVAVLRTAPPTAGGLPLVDGPRAPGRGLRERNRRASHGVPYCRGYAFGGRVDRAANGSTKESLQCSWMRASHRERVLIVGVAPKGLPRGVAEDHLDELERLVDTAGGEVVARFVKERAAPDPATYIGKGAVEEIGAAARGERATLVVFDDELSPGQARNLEK